MKPWLGNPRLHFVVLGVLVFALDAQLNQHSPTSSLSISPDGRELIQAPETNDPKDWVEREVLYREALRLGLDEGDTIVRRRLIQKMEYMLEMTAGSEPYTREDIEAYYQAHKADYSRPAEYRFAQVYLDPNKHGDNLKAQAIRLRGELSTADVAYADAGRYGDAYAGRSLIHAANPDWIRAEFGQAFWAGLTEAPMGEWHGPLRSRYGWHLVRLEAIQPESMPQLGAVWNRVVLDFDKQRREQARQENLKRLRQRYKIIAPDG